MSAWHPRWPGFGKRGSLLLPLPPAAFAELAPNLEVDGLELARKREFHVTLLDRALAARLHMPAPGGPLAERLPALFASLDWQWRRRGERWLLQEECQGQPVHSVIELLKMPALNEFRHALANLLGEPVASTPAHVTLYTAGTAIGIGLASQVDFERLRLRPL